MFPIVELISGIRVDQGLRHRLTDQGLPIFGPWPVDEAKKPNNMARMWLPRVLYVL